MVGRVSRAHMILESLMLLASASLFAAYPQAMGSEPTPDALALNSVRRALTCLESRGSTRPLVALTPERLLQFHRRLRRVRHDPICKKGRHTRFCGVGNCYSDGCRCLFGFAGDRCDVYPGRCWLMHCFLHDCYSASGARLRCVCDRDLYGTRVLSSLYWYNEGLQGAYRPPPPSWHDVVPMQADNDLEAYTMDGVDDEIDLTLYQQAVAAAASPAKAEVAARESSPLADSKGESEQPLLKATGYSESASTATSFAGNSWIHFGSGLLNKTLRVLPKYELPKIVSGSKLLGQMILMRNVSTKSTASQLSGDEREIIANNVKSTLEKDFGGNAKFAYEDYASPYEGVVPSFSPSSATKYMDSIWPLWVSIGILETLTTT
ncbi:uncharacterized protein [Dermacentor albipictus]|uniref:uncharacterized protein n=1 Tax=Dermacentor albipictus TaxID=60249 RepID=UPI0038FC9D78